MRLVELVEEKAVYEKKNVKEKKENNKTKITPKGFTFKLVSA